MAKIDPKGLAALASGGTAADGAVAFGALKKNQAKDGGDTGPGAPPPGEVEEGGGPDEDDGDKEPDGDEGQMPQLWALQYVPPSSSGEPRSCSNCLLFATGPTKCMIHGPDTEVTPLSVCGRHVDGQPHDDVEPDHQFEPLDPAYTGLTETDAGAACSGCVNFADGTCKAAVGEGDGPAEVEAAGFCSAWSPAGSGGEEEQPAEEEPGDEDGSDEGGDDGSPVDGMGEE